jgi:hypothetical protein
MEKIPQKSTTLKLLKSLANQVLFTMSIMALLVTSCEKEEISDFPVPPSIIDIEGPESLSIVPVGSTISLLAKTNIDQPVTYEWKVNGNFLPVNMPKADIFIAKGGVYEITLTTTNKAGADSLKIKYFAIDRPNGNSSKWISEIVEFRPAPGQYSNKSPGNPESAQTIVGKKGMVSLGGYGGYIVFKFDHSVANEEGDDFVIHGNAFKGNSEPGIVAVAYDANGNGKPDEEEWYDIAGSAHEAPATNRNYSITYYKPSQTETAEDIRWTDNTGAEGFIKAISFHRQCYYPLFYPEGVPDEITFSGTLLSAISAQDPDSGNWVSGSPGWGYADNYSEKYPLIVNGDNDTRNTGKFDISNAVDKEGNQINLIAADFIKVYTGVNQSAGWLGEISTEICGAISLRAE